MFTFGLPVSNWLVPYPGLSALTRTFQFYLHVCSKILANLTVYRKIRPNKIIKQYNQPSRQLGYIGPGTYLYFRLFSIYSMVRKGRQSPLFCRFSFLFLTITRSGRLAEIRWSVCISKSQRRLYFSFSKTESQFCIYHEVEFKLLAQFPVDHLPRIRV